jgi:predicted Zn-dependent protease
MSEPAADPHEAEVQQSLLWLRSNFVNHAERLLAKVLADAPQNWLARRLHGITLHKLGRHDEGIAEIAAAAEQGSQSPRAWADLAVALRDAGRLEAADRAYARGVALQSAGIEVPPLAGQAFSTDLGQHEFTVLD